MTTYRISNVTGGQGLGIYEADDEQGAILAMARDAGYDSIETMDSVTGGHGDLVVTEDSDDAMADLSDLIVIDSYTGQWQEACRPEAPEVGQTVRVRHDRSPDGRELDDFRRVLRVAQLDWQWIASESDDDRDYDVYEIIATEPDEDPSCYDE